MTWMNTAAKSHFFAASMARWKTAGNVEHLITEMQRDGLPFNVWWVPKMLGDSYKIDWFEPRVEGAICIATYEKEPKE